MRVRGWIQRAGVVLTVAGIVLATVDIDPRGEIARAAAAEAGLPVVAASPEPVPAATALVASPEPAPEDAAVAASPVPEASPGSSDLTHLAFTATDDLAASLVAPAAGAVTSATTSSVEVETVRGAGVELQVGENVVPFTRIGRRSVDNKTGATRYTYYGVTFAPGPNVLALTALGAAGARGPTTTYEVYGPGRPTTLTLAARGPLRADGATTAQIVVAGRDAWGHPAAGSVVQLVLVSGDARLERIDAHAYADAAVPVPAPSTSPPPDPHLPAGIRQTLDVPLGSDGSAIVRLRPGLTPGDIVLRAEAGPVTGDARFFLAPNLRKPFVTGLVTAGAGAVPGLANQADGEPDGTNARRGRIAVFGTGALGSALATFAYDTADRLQRTPSYGGAYDADPNDRPYVVTGDASARRDDALSRDHLFARLDAGRTTAQWGEFRAQTSAGDSTLGGFDQLVDGAKLDLNGTTRRASLFAARNDVGYDRRVFAPSGLANGIALRSDIVVGSEIVVLATLDAHSGAIVTQTPLTRGVDYTIEYATGQLRFIDIPLPFDEFFNPRQIVLTYEYNAPGNAAQTVGGRAEATLGRAHAVRLGAGYVNDTSGAGNVTLATQDVGGTFAGGNWNITHATSHGALLPTSALLGATGAGGNALHASFNDAAGADRLAFQFDRTSTGYNDPFGGLTSPGLLNERLSYTHRSAGGAGEVALDVGHQSNLGIDGAGNAQTTAALRARRTFTKRFALTASVERRVATNGGAAPAPFGAGIPSATPAPPGTLPAYQPPPAEASTQVALGADWRAAKAVDLAIDRVQTISGSNDVQPAQTDVQLSYDLGKSGRAYLRERWSASPVQSFAASTQSFTAATGGTHSTQIGFARQLSPATSVDTSWSVDHTANGGDVYAAMGARERFKLGHIGGDAFFQHALSNGDNLAGAGFNLYGLSLNYADAAGRFHASGASQLRTGANAGVSITLGALGAISPEISLFAVVNDARSVSSSQSDARVGMAWRPSRSDDGVTLLQFERQDGTASTDATQSGVLSLEQVLRVRTRTTLVGRYAYKLDGDTTYAAHSSLVGMRIDQTIGARFDLGVEARRSAVRGIAGGDATALALESGVRLGDSTRLAAGYNFSATADPSLATSPVHRGFYTTITSVVDHLFGWGKH